MQYFSIESIHTSLELWKVFTGVPVISMHLAAGMEPLVDNEGHLYNVWKGTIFYDTMKNCFCTYDDQFVHWKNQLLVAVAYSKQTLLAPTSCSSTGA